jgi:hypothetical protein
MAVAGLHPATRSVRRCVLADSTNRAIDAAAFATTCLVDFNAHHAPALLAALVVTLNTGCVRRLHVGRIPLFRNRFSNALAIYAVTAAAWR